MIKKLKNISELPKWFQLKKYTAAKQLDADGWYQQLRIRGLMLMFFECEEVDVRDGLINNPDFKKGVELLRNKPIVDLKGDDFKFSVFFRFDDLDTAFKGATPNYLLGINLMTLEEFNTLKKNIDPSRLEYITKWQAQYQDCVWDSLKLPADEYEEWQAHFAERALGWSNRLPYKYEEWIGQPVQNSVKQKLGSDPVLVDLSFSDKILIENFKRYLAIRRSETKTEHLSKPDRQHNFAEWIRQGVLPYLDLKIWELESNTKIPLRVIADAIYPQGEGGEENVRKTTIPLAKFLSQPEHLRQLVAQASIELAEKSKD